MWAERRAPSATTWALDLALHAGVLALLNTRTRLPDMPRTWNEIRLNPSRPAEAQPAPPLAVEARLSVDAPTPVETSPAVLAEPSTPLRLMLPDTATLARQPALDDPRGNTCINLHRNSGAARDRLNESMSPTLWSATPATAASAGDP